VLIYGNEKGVREQMKGDVGSRLRARLFVNAPWSTNPKREGTGSWDVLKENG